MPDISGNVRLINEILNKRKKFMMTQMPVDLNQPKPHFPFDACVRLTNVNIGTQSTANTEKKEQS